MKKFNELRKELSETILLGKTIQMGDRRGRIVGVVSVGETSRYDTVYRVKFQDGTKVEMHDSQIRPFIAEENGAGEEATDELDDNYREDTPGQELDERRSDVYAIVDKKGKVVSSNLTKKNAHKEAGYMRDVTIVLDPDAKVGDTLKYFAKESVEQLDEVSYVKVTKGKYKGMTGIVYSSNGYENATYLVSGNKLAGDGKPKIISSDNLENAKGSDRKTLIKIHADGKNKIPGHQQVKRQMKDLMKESAPMNSVGGGMSPHFGGEGAIQGTDAHLGKKKPKKRKRFAGAEVFEMNSDEYHSCMYGRKKYERWNKKMNMENIDNQDIRKYAHKNPGKPIVIMDKSTGAMSYFYHGDKK